MSRPKFRIIPVFKSRANSERVLAAMAATAREFEVSMNDLLGHRRYEPLATARQVAMWVIHEQDQLKLHEISKLFGRRAHNSTWAACANVKTWMRLYPRFLARVTAIRAALENGGAK